MDLVQLMTEIEKSGGPSASSSVDNEDYWRDVAKWQALKIQRIESFLRDGNNYDLGGDIARSTILEMLDDSST